MVLRFIVGYGSLLQETKKMAQLSAINLIFDFIFI
jgi:hypothetical protein